MLWFWKFVLAPLVKEQYGGPERPNGPQPKKTPEMGKMTTEIGKNTREVFLGRQQPHGPAAGTQNMVGVFYHDSYNTDDGFSG